MGLFYSLKSAFNPTDKVATARRVSVFGTPSKVVSAGVIAAGAAAAIAAPIIGLGVIAKKGATAIASTSLTTKVVAGLVAAPVLAAVASNPKVVTRTAGGLLNFETNAVKLASNPSLQGAKNLIAENPVISAGLLLAGAAAVGGTAVAANAISNSINTNAIKENTEAILGGSSIGSTSPLPSSFSDSKEMVGMQDEPLTPATQVIGKPVSTGTSVPRAPRRTRARATESRSSVRVNVLNQQTFISARR